jgi:uncharacterized membrane protein
LCELSLVLILRRSAAPDGGLRYFDVLGGGSTVMQNMMDNMMGGMGWAMGLVGLLVLLVLVLVVAALVKYLFFK